MSGLIYSYVDLLPSTITSTSTSRAQNPRQPTLCTEQFFSTVARMFAAEKAFSKEAITATPPAAMPPVPIQTFIETSLFMIAPE